MQSAAGRSDRPGGERIDRPRLRQDLLAEAVDEHGARFIDVMDPDSGSVFRFFEVEYSLACAMDGERDVAGIVKWAQDELGMSPSPGEVRAVITTLGDLGFIEPSAAAASPAGPELAPSIVVGQAAARPAPVTDVELGAPGTSPSRRDREPVRGGDIALGAAGGPARRPQEPVEDIALGAPGARGQARTPPTGTPAASRSPSAQRRTEDVSVDLADHIAVRPDDVKEAVRASRVMAAVEAPRDLDKPGGPAPASMPPVPAPRSPELGRPGAGPTPPAGVAAVRPSAAAVSPSEPGRPSGSMARPPDVARPPDLSVPRQEITRQSRPEIGRPAKPPVELPNAPAATAETTMPQAPARTGSSPLLIALLVIVVLGAGGFLVWKYVLSTPDADVGANTAPAQSVRPLPPPPPPPPAPSAKIASDLPPPDEIRTTRAGVVETILADQTPVKEGDIVVRLVGDKPLEAEIGNFTRDEKKLEDQIDATTRKRDAMHAASNKAGEAAAQADLATKQAQLATKQGQLAGKTTELDKFLIHAPAAGVVAPLAKLGQKLAAADTVIKLQRDAKLVATFKVADTRQFAVDGSVDLAVGTGDQHVSCTISDVQPGSVKVMCPSDPALAEGSDVTLKLPPAATPPGAAAPAAPPVPGAAGAPAAPASGSDGAPGATGMSGNATVPATGSDTGSAAAPATGSAAQR